MHNKRWILLSRGSFFCYYSTHKEKFRFYCEVVITRDGQICLPIQCGHGDMLRDLCKEVDSKIIADPRAGLYELLTATRAITVSYMNQIIVEDFYSVEQEETYEFLVSLGLILRNLKTIEPHYLIKMED